MGCVASKLEGEEEVVAICRERKRQLKLALERRYALADAHCRYYRALYGVSAAINLFVARHSSPSSPFLITFPPPCPPSPPKQNVASNPLLLQQRPPSEPTPEAIGCESCDLSTSSDSSEEEIDEEVEKEEPQICGYFYMEMPRSMPSPQRDFGWDFFNPFTGVRPEIVTSYNRMSEEDLRAVREQEGIPDLEEEGERIVEVNKEVAVAEENKKIEHEESGTEVVRTGDGVHLKQGDQKGLTVSDTPIKGRELLEALKDIEDHFIRAYDAGKDVSRMLEANRAHLQSNLEELKENSTKLIQAITWRSTSSRSSSSKSLLPSSSKNSSTWTEFKNSLFDDYEGMVSGSHSSTLGRLYAWEKKLYEEVKDGDGIQKLYERKCNHLRNQEAREEEGFTVDKSRAAVKDLYSRILVTIRRAESISKRIEKLRDEELQPQIFELLQGLMRTWNMMSESHEIQNKIMFEVKTFTCPTHGKFCNNTHQLATQKLESELQNWHACFTEYIVAQKEYIEALYGWLSKFVVPEVEFCSKSTNPNLPCRVNSPPLLIICHNWLACLEMLPDKAVVFAIKSLGRDVRALGAQQGQELQQKRKVQCLSKELDRKVLAFQKVENRIFESKISDHTLGSDIEHRAKYLKERKNLLDNFRKKVEVEKEKHQNCMQETQRITLNGFQTGFCRVFESLTEFSNASLKMYNDLVSFNPNAEKIVNPSCIEGSQIEENGKR